MLANTYGHFDPSGRAFTITNPGTPMPWCNVVCNGRYGFIVSHNGGGFSWFDDAQHNVLTRWEMDLVRDCYGKFVYVSELDATGNASDTWSLAPAPCRATYDRYACTHTLGSTTFETARKGIEATWTMAVAPGDHVELWSVELRNTSDRPRSLRICSYFEWTCGVAPDSKREFHRLFFNTGYDAQRRAIFATKNMWDIRPKTEREHWNQPWPYHAAHTIGWSTPPAREIAIGDKSTFLGRYGATHAPAAMARALPASGGFGRFGDSIAALGGEITIPPGGSVKVHYAIAIAETRTELEVLVDRYRDGGAASAAITASGDSWSRRLSAGSVQSAREDFDLLNNHWLPYQAISGRLWGRTGYYQQSGAFGFRDQLQDSQVWLPLEPQRCLDQIMLHAERQFADGSVYHWWHALADFGNHTACSDDYLWLPFVVSAYLRETGDYAMLTRSAKFVDDPKGGTILEHCRRSIARAFKRTSPRGLPYIGSCDWNDGLSAMGIDEQGESVWLGMFLCDILDDWSIILDRIGEESLAKGYRERRSAYAGAINQHAWESPAGHSGQSGQAGQGPQAGGQGGHGWYRYGTKDSGEWIGAAECAEGKIHLNAQTWSILADVAPPERARTAWQSVKDKLLSPYGPLLLWPAYTVPDPTIGYVTRYSPGSRENGGVYMHAATWALAAAAKMRDSEAVGRIWKSISPASRGQDAESYWAEPYVTPGNVDGPLSDKPGRAGWTWYTGSAAWLNRVCLEWVLGIRPVFAGGGAGGAGESAPGEEGGLMIDPCPPEELGQVNVTRTWRGVQVRVRFDAAEFARQTAIEGTGWVQPHLTVNGKTLDGCVLPPSLAAGLSAGRKVIDVEVRWARAAGANGAAIHAAPTVTPARAPDIGRA